MLSACRELIDQHTLWQNGALHLQLRLLDEHLPLHFQGCVFQVALQSNDLLVLIGAHCEILTAWHPQQLPATYLQPLASVACDPTNRTRCRAEPSAKVIFDYTAAVIEADRSVQFTVRSPALRGGAVRVRRSSADDPWSYEPQDFLTP
jgi:hypothetical protein